MLLCTAQGIADNSLTSVENIFITQFMPNAPQNALEVYLYGLYLTAVSDEEMNNLDVLMRKLSLTEDEVLEAFSYWEQLGIVIITSVSPMQVKYLAVRGAVLHRKISPQKYSGFNKKMQGALSGRMLTPNEFGEYYAFLEESGFEPDALVKVAQYCAELKGTEISGRYILTVAQNLVKSNLRTYEKVSEKLAGYAAFSDDLFEIAKALHLRRGIDYNDRRLYEKWTGEWGFSFDAVRHAALKLKRGSMERLDKAMGEYRKANAMSPREIDAYAGEKTALMECAFSLNRIIGVYYQNVDFIVEEYIVKWNNMGYDTPTLELIARYCFKQNIRSLEELDATVKRFYKLGITTAEGINQLLESLLREDGLIRQVIAELGLVRGITQYDRRTYRVWEEWGFDFETILHVARQSSADYNPMACLNKTLSRYRSEGLFTLKKIKSCALPPLRSAAKPSPPPERGLEHSYTREDLNALFDVLGDME